MKKSDKLWYFSHLIYMFSVTPDGATMYHGPCSQERLQLTMCLSGLNDQQPTQQLTRRRISEIPKTMERVLNFNIIPNA